MKFAIRALFTALLITFSLAAQDKPPDKTAIVDSFKQKIQDFVNSENSAAGPEHAKVNSIDTPPLNAKKKMLHKDGTPCTAFHTGMCHWAWVDESGGEYLNSAGKPCGGDSCIVWMNAYIASVSADNFDVKQTDSLVTPYTGILTYTEISWSTADHATKDEAEKDSNFSLLPSESLTSTYGYQDGQWNLLKQP
ncbi:MAG: hypothetical protein WA871_10325 [Candidatus Acidiferrales bacterium]